MAKANNNRRSGSNRAVQVIPVQTVAASKIHTISKDWAPAFKVAEEVEDLAGDIEKILSELAPKYKKLGEKIAEAYRVTPATDCGFNMSPIGPHRVLYALKNHLRKHGMAVDNVYIGDPTKIKEFKDYVLDATKWLLKLSTMNK